MKKILLVLPAMLLVLGGCLHRAPQSAPAQDANASLSQPWQSFLSGGKPSALEAKFHAELIREPGNAADAFALARIMLARGEREKALVTAVEGLKNAPGSPLAFLLEGMISSQAFYNSATTKLVRDSLPLLLHEQSLDPQVRFNLHWLALHLAARESDAAGMKRAFQDCGFVPNPWYSKPVTHLARLAFLETWRAEKGELATRKWTSSPLFQTDLRAPLYAVPNDRESTYLMLVPFRVEHKTKALLFFNASLTSRVVLDGRETLFTNDFFNKQPSPSVLQKLQLSPGYHYLLVKLFVASPSDSVHMALLDAKGGALPVQWISSKLPPGPPAASQNLGEARDRFETGFPVSDPRYEAFRALFLRWQGDVARGRLEMERALETHPDCVIWNLWEAGEYLFESDDLPDRVAQSRAESAVNRTLQKDPDCPMALFYRALLKAKNSQGDDDLAILRDLTEKYPTDYRWFLQLASRLEQKRWMYEARTVLNHASSFHPDSPDVDLAWIQFYESIPDREGEWKAIERLSRLRNVFPEKERFYGETGRFKDLHALYLKEIGRLGDRDLQFATKLASLDSRMGEYSSAVQRLDQIRQKDPNNPAPAFFQARCLFLEGKDRQAKALWKKLKQEKPSLFQIDMAEWILGAPLPFQKHHLSLKEVLAQDKVQGPELAPSSLILDQDFTKVEPDGSSIERYHGIVRVNNKSGVDREGEQTLPGQVILSIRTVKPDGTVLEPEAVPEKRTVSMQGLEPGDLIEYEYLTFTPPNRIRKDSYISNQVYLFQDIEKPFHRTQWYFEYPASMDMRFYEQNLPHPAKMLKLEHNLVKDWEFRAMPRLAPEPNTPYKTLFLPMAQAVGGVTWKDLGLFMKNQLVGQFEETPELRRIYDKLLKGAGNRIELLNKIIQFVETEINGEGGQSWQDPTQTVLTRRGNRLQVAATLMKMAGIHYQVLLAEPVPNEVDRDNLPQLGQYGIPVLRVSPGEGTPERYYTLSDPYREPGLLPWFLAGAKAMNMDSNDPWRLVTLPVDLVPWMKASQSEVRTLNTNGDLLIKHTQVLDPDASASLRRSLAKINKDRWKQVFQVALSHQYGNADLEKFSLQNLENMSKPVQWSYTVMIHGFATNVGGRIMVDEPLPPLELGQALASLQSRKLPLSTGSPLYVNEKYTLILPPGWKADYTPPELDLKSSFGRYRLKTVMENGKIVFERHLSLPFQVVWPDRYAAFSRFLNQIDEAESGQLVLSPVKGQQPAAGDGNT
jgi:tetratricopeptide (TPR) repeat protein